MDSFAIEFDGYWRERKKGGIPAEPGVYCVYTCIYSGKKQTWSPHKSAGLPICTTAPPGEWRHEKLVYIGASENVRECIADHVKQADWESHIDTREELCFSFGAMDAETLERCAAALIFKHKPPENSEYARDFPFDTTSLTLSGTGGFLSKSFTV